MLNISTFCLFLSLLSIGLGQNQFLFHDGVFAENIPFLEDKHVYNYDVPKLIDLHGLIGTNKEIIDIQFASNYFIFVQAENDLYILCYNFSNYKFRFRSYIPPYVKHIHNDVNFFRIMSLDEYGHVHLYIELKSQTGSEFVTFNGSLNLSSDITFGFLEFGPLKDISIHGDHQAYFIYPDGNYGNITYFNGDPYIYDLYSSGTQVDYPGICEEFAFRYVHPWNPTAYFEESPYYIVASQGFSDQKSVIGFHSTMVRGYVFEILHPLFNNTCDLNIVCNFKHPNIVIDAIAYTPTFGAIVDQGELYLYTSDSEVKQFPLMDTSAWEDYSSKMDYSSKRDINDLLNLALHDTMDPLVLITYENTTRQLNTMLYNDFMYILEPLSYGFTNLNYTTMNLSQIYLFEKELYFLYGNGTLTRSNDVFQQNILGCSVDSKILLCWGNKFALIGEEYHEFPHEIEKIGHGSAGPSDYYIYFKNQKVLYSSNDITSNVSLLSDADNAWFDNSKAIFQKGNELYCDPKSNNYCHIDAYGTPMIFEGPEPLLVYPMIQGVMQGKTIKDVKMTQEQHFFLTTDGYLYTLGEYDVVIAQYSRDETKRNREDETILENNSHEMRLENTIRPIDNENINGKICSIHSTSSHTIYIQLCETHEVYVYGHRPNDFTYIGESGYIRPKELAFDSVRKIEELSQAYKLKSIASEGPSVYLLYENACDEAVCGIDELIGDGGTIVLPNSTIVIVTGPSVIGNTTIIINNGTTIIIEDTLTVSNSTITYKIPTQDILDSIQDGDRIVIIDASQGQIDGEFDKLILDYEEDPCKELNATLEQNDKEVAIIFHVKNTCGFPIWAIILIIIGIILIAVVIILIVLRNMIFKHRAGHVKSRDAHQIKTESTDHNNELYESSTKKYKNPTYHN